VEQEVDLAALLRDVTEDERSLAKERKISMELSLPTRLVITTDPTLLQIVLHNILSNAVKYSEAGDTVRVSLAEEGQKAIVSVQDTGIGIPAGEQKYLFTRLFRASNATKMDTTGSGLGLYISRIIVEQLKGHMTFQSRENEGTTFVLELPLSMWKKPDGATTEASPS
jgi:signal transduction histidine kinase